MHLRALTITEYEKINQTPTQTHSGRTCRATGINPEIHLQRTDDYTLWQLCPGKTRHLGRRMGVWSSLHVSKRP